jgi:hypothetical protein
MRPVTVASSHPSAYCWPEAEEPGDCSAALLADDRFFAAALPDDCWAAAPDDHSVPEVRLRGSAAEDSAQAGYSASADSSRADCLEQAAPVPGGSAAEDSAEAGYSASADSSRADCLEQVAPVPGGSAAEDSAEAGSSASADSSRDDCLEQVAPVPGGSAVRTQDDHSAQEVRTADYSAQADSVADDWAARCLLAFLPDGCQADSQPVA